MSAAETTDRTEQHAWQDLLNSPGWDLLVTHARVEWDGPAFVNQVEQLADNSEDPTALSKLRQLLAAKRAVMRLLKAPEEQVAKLKRVPTLSIEDLVSSQNRRGRL